MDKLLKVLRSIANPPKCKHGWIEDRQGKYCHKCGRREYAKSFIEGGKT